MDSDWKPRLWAVPLPRHYIIARQACLRRQIFMLLLQTKAQGASSTSDEFSATHTQLLSGLLHLLCSSAQARL